MVYTIEGLTKRRAQGAGYCLEIRHLAIRKGDKLAITGPSGCGKSTTLDILGLILQPDQAGTYTFTPDHEPVDLMACWKEARVDALAWLRLQYMGYVLQTGGLLPFLSVAENMTLTARMRGRDAAETAEDMHALARRLGIESLLQAMPSTLSIGERQRTAIVRALLSRPQLILADEPTAALDPLHADRVMDVFLRAVEEQGCSLIMVTHDAGFARRGGLREVAFRMEDDGAGGVRAVLDDPLWQETMNKTI